MTGRALHLTFHKCGSQWVRDVLAAPEVVATTGCALHRDSVDLHFERWPDQPVGTFMGPVYNAARHDWSAVARADDRAVVVLRDPRDRAVSMAQSAAFSHVPNPYTRLTRPIVVSLSPALRLRQAFADLMHIGGALWSWVAADCADARVLLMTYEGIIADERGAFARILDHFGWRLPTPTLDAVVARLSFRARSGRLPGQADEFSHYRKGVAGDWRGYLDRQLGADLEAAFPGLLVALGYETSGDWWRELPAAAAPLPGQLGPMDMAAQYEQLAELTALRERVLQLQHECEARGRCIDELDQAARERLELINRLSAVPRPSIDAGGAGDEVMALRQQVRDLEAECQARARCIAELDAEARRRLALIESMTAAGAASGNGVSAD